MVPYGGESDVAIADRCRPARICAPAPACGGTGGVPGRRCHDARRYCERAGGRLPGERRVGPGVRGAPPRGPAPGAAPGVRGGPEGPRDHGAPTRRRGLPGPRPPVLDLGPHRRWIHPGGRGSGASQPGDPDWDPADRADHPAGEGRGLLAVAASHAALITSRDLPARALAGPGGDQAPASLIAPTTATAPSGPVAADGAGAVAPAVRGL